jgi:hypothetical protein
MANEDQVFVVHGRNGKARLALFDFLRAIGLKPLEWNQLVVATGQGSPYIGDVVKKGFEIAQAAVVLMTPDDEARLKQEFWTSSDTDDETKFNGQPRQNVILEAGMALAFHENRTVIVELGRVRKMSDIDGRHVVRFDGSVEKRQELADKLRGIGCHVDIEGKTDWQSTGDFVSVVAGNTSPDTADDSTATSAPQNTLPELSDDATPATPTKKPTSVSILRLGEILWYLCNAHATSANDLVTVIRSFLTQLELCQLTRTSNAASVLSNINVYYDMRSNLTTTASANQLANLMIPVRAVLEEELRDKLTVNWPSQ